MTDILQEKRNVLIEAYTLAKKAEDVLRYSYGKIDPSQLGVSKDPDFLETQAVGKPSRTWHCPGL